MPCLLFFCGVLRIPEVYGKGGLFILEAHICDHARVKCTQVTLEDVQRAWGKPVHVSNAPDDGLSIGLLIEAFRRDRFDFEVARAQRVLFTQANLSVTPVLSHRIRSQGHRAPTLARVKRGR